MKKKDFNLKLFKKSGLVFLASILLVVALGFSSLGKTFIKKTSVYFSNISNKELSSAKRSFWLPSGRETYQIVQAEGVHPKIYEATIDPPDVHMGDRQTLSIIVSDDYAIVSVVAKIETDKGIRELPLNYMREVKDRELKPKKAVINEKNQVLIRSSWDALRFVDILSRAEAHGAPKLFYENSWVVEDTHDATYRTTFVVKNVKGDENSITLAWSDACGIPYSGNWNLNANCTISSPDGMDNGNATIQTYTLTLNSTFAYAPGNSVTINSGAVAIGSSGQFKETYLWYLDEDGDGAPWPSLELYAQDSLTGGRRRNTLGNPNLIDCNPTDSRYFYVGNLYTNFDGDQALSDYTRQVCMGEIPPGYSQTGGTDCNDDDLAYGCRVNAFEQVTCERWTHLQCQLF